MSKAPNNLPEQGDRVKLRGRGAVGELVWLNGDWSWIAWDEMNVAPLICHRHELEKLAA